MRAPNWSQFHCRLGSWRTFNANGTAGTKIGEWAYDYVTLTGTGGNPPALGGGQNAVPCFHTVTVTDPLGHATVNYFDSATPAVSRWQYGLPFRRCNDSGQLLSPPYLSQEVYEGSVASGTKLRSIYVEYESDGRDAGSHPRS